MGNNNTLVEVKTVLKNIIAILTCENENNWVHAFEKMGFKVDMALDGSLSKYELLEYINDSYRSIYQGNGSFSDFSIWRDDVKERFKANNEFKLLTSKLLDLIK